MTEVKFITDCKRCGAYTSCEVCDVDTGDEVHRVNLCADCVSELESEAT